MNDNPIIDARDYGCPLPVTMAKAALSKVKSGVVEVLVGGKDALDNLRRFAQGNSMGFEEEQIEDYWKVKITKGASVIEPVPARQAAALPEAKIFLVISTDVLGKEDELGRILIRAFFEAMRATGDYPHTIFFLNAGVRLTTLDENVFPILQELKENGVEIFSCGTCLKFYGLESQLKVGDVGSILQTVEALKKFKVVWA